MLLTIQENTELLSPLLSLNNTFFCSHAYPLAAIMQRFLIPTSHKWWTPSYRLGLLLLTVSGNAPEFYVVSLDHPIANKSHISYPVDISCSGSYCAPVVVFGQWHFGLFVSLVSLFTQVANFKETESARNMEKITHRKICEKRENALWRHVFWLYYITLTFLLFNLK